MIIIKDEYQKKVFELVEKHAKYQKVMLIYDNNVSNIKISEIYNEIKEICIFNKCEHSQLNNEIFNGYKMLVFMCSSDSFLKINANIDEFLNVFCSTDGNIFPFLISSTNKINNKNNYVISNKNVLDVSMMASLIFNKFFNMVKNLNYIDLGAVEKNIYLEDVELEQSINIEKVNENDEFVDVDILKQCELDYKLLPLVDMVLIDAFLIVFQAIKQQQLSLVDIYKSCKEDYDKVDKFYALFENENFPSVVKLNFSFLTGLLLKYKSKIKDCLDVVELEECEIQHVLTKVKEYCKKHTKFVKKPHSAECGKGVELIDTTGKKLKELFNQLLRKMKSSF